MSKRIGIEILLKDETANPLRSFKGRGATNLLSAERPSELVCASAGNFGQGIAWAARSREIPVTVFVPENVVASKANAIKSLGAHVVAGGVDFDAAKKAAIRHAKEHRLAFVEDGAHPALAEGAGTLALELLEQAGRLDALLCPVGNGALAAGVGCWVRHAAPNTRVIGVCAEGAPCMAASWHARRVVETVRAETIADGIAVRVPVPAAVEQLARYLDDMVKVSDSLILLAMELIKAETGISAEPSGAVALAALLLHHKRWHGGRVGVIVSGGNI